MKSIGGILLCRNEEKFNNQFNFPSKVVEALSLCIPIYSIYKISGVDKSLYILTGVTEFNISCRADYSNKRRSFLSLCEASRLRKWVDYEKDIRN